MYYQQQQQQQQYQEPQVAMRGSDGGIPQRGVFGVPQWLYQYFYNFFMRFFGQQIQELQAQNQALGAENQALTAENAALGQQMQQQTLSEPIDPNSHGEVPTDDSAATSHDAINTGVDRYALLIGINYKGQQGELRGCVNDCNKMWRTIKQHCGFSKAMFMFEDMNELQHPQDRVTTLAGRTRPTRSNILNAFECLVDLANDSIAQGRKPVVFVHYSGHGGTQAALDPTTEIDGNDETWIPVDYNTAGVITDNEVMNVLCKRLPRGTDCFFVTDCCHSGSNTDLPYRWDARTDACVVENGDLLAANIQQWTGCSDEQTSADAYISQKYQGAMTAAFCEVLPKAIDRGDSRVSSIADMIHLYMSTNRYEQRPQVSSSTAITAKTPILLLKKYSNDPEGDASSSGARQRRETPYIDPITGGIRISSAPSLGRLNLRERISSDPRSDYWEPPSRRPQTSRGPPRGGGLRIGDMETSWLNRLDSRDRMNSLDAGLRVHRGTTSGRFVMDDYGGISKVKV